MAEIPDSLPPDLSPAEQSRRDEADLRLGELGVYLTGPKRFEIIERIRRLVVELIEQRDRAAVASVMAAAMRVRLALSNVDATADPYLAGAAHALRTVAEQLERQAGALASRLGLTRPATEAGAPPPTSPPAADASGSGTSEA